MVWMEERGAFVCLPWAVLEFVNSVGLVAPGSRAFYKVYVKLTTGNGRGSNTVSVVRE